VIKFDHVEAISGGDYLKLSTVPAMITPSQPGCTTTRVPGVNVMATAAKVSQPTNVHLAYVLYWDTINGPEQWRGSFNVTIVP